MSERGGKGPAGAAGRAAASPEVPEGQPAAALRVLALTVAALIGAAAGILALPAIFRSAPNDMERAATLLAALGRTEGEKPEVAVLGDSVSMSAFDGKRMAGELPGRPVVWNLASTGQTLYESLLLEDRLPETTATVVLGILPDMLRQEAPELPDNKYVAYYMYGYRPGEDARRAAEEIGDERFLAQIRRGDLRMRLDGRWIVRAGFDTWVRRRLRRDLEFGTAMNDLYYPQPYADPVSAEALDRQMLAFHEARPAFRTTPATRSVLAAIGRAAARRGRKLTVVVMPEHPRVRALAAPAFYEELRAELPALERETGAPFLDLHDLLGEEDFVDHLHLRASGAAVLTRSVATRLSAARR